MAVKVLTGNIFNSEARVLVNTVNCVGIMGKGIALVYKLRYPKMFDIYKDYCDRGLISIGKLWIYKGETDQPWVLNFPTKDHWKNPSKIEYVTSGLKKFVETYKEQGIQSIAFPVLGAFNGGLDAEQVVPLMQQYLSQCDIPIEIFEFDPLAKDDLYDQFVSRWSSFTSDELKTLTGIRNDRLNKITEAINSGKINSMIDLINERGIGLTTMETCYSFVMKKGN